MIYSDISVVIPTCKTSDLLWQTIDSALVAASSGKIREIVVVPNAGQKNSVLGVEIQERYNNPLLRVVIRQQPQIIPIFANWDDSISHVTSEYVHILHDDDLVDPDFYTVANEIVAQHPDAALIYLPARFIGDFECDVSPPANPGVWNEASLSLAVRNPFFCPGVIFKKSLHSGFDTSLEFTSDWRAWYFLSIKGKVIIYDRCICSYRIHGQNSTTRIISEGTNVRESLLTATLLSDHYEKSTGHRPDNISDFAASLGYAESVNAAKRGDFRVTCVQLYLAFTSKPCLYSLARSLKRIIVSLSLGRKLRTKLTL